MSRQPRVSSGTEIYHVMMRGINHQNIFEEPEDYYQFINTLDRLRVLYDDLGLPCGTSFTLYGYCLMANHFHLLIREREDTIGNIVKRIASSYVYYYNHKYLRDGHLFKERFKSEPVNDMEYFTTLLRYIHQNPVKAGIVTEVKDYEPSKSVIHGLFSNVFLSTTSSNGLMNLCLVMLVILMVMKNRHSTDTPTKKPGKSSRN